MQIKARIPTNERSQERVYIGDGFLRIIGITARQAGRLPWRKEMALAVLFIGTPLVTGDVEVFALNLVGLGIGAMVLRKVMQSRRQAEAARTRPTPAASAARRTR